jgi:hypothetical protein
MKPYEVDALAMRFCMVRQKTSQVFLSELPIDKWCLTPSTLLALTFTYHVGLRERREEKGGESAQISKESSSQESQP